MSQNKPTRIGYFLGFIQGWWSGRKEGIAVTKLFKKYGALGMIPTRELRATGPASEMMVRRQMVLGALAYLLTLQDRFGLKPPIHTMDAVSAWVNFKKLDGEDVISLENISRSEAILHALADYAVRVDGFELEKLHEHLKAIGSYHIWHGMLADNHLFFVEG